MSNMQPPIVLRQSYGKSQVRLSRIYRQGKRHEFIDLTLRIELDGEFAAAYDQGNNARVVPTDTIKNTVYVLARRQGISSIEAFACRAARHFLDEYAHVERVEIRCEETPWARVERGGIEHPHAFVGGSSQRFTCALIDARGQVTLRSGLKGLQLLKTTASGFSGFLQDEYTTLRETDDRIFATSLEASWPCQNPDDDWSRVRRDVREAIVDVFANEYSKSVQHTLYRMGAQALVVAPQIDEIEITMPNQHHLLVDLSFWQLTNNNEIFVPTSEPFGRISATIARGAVQRR